MKINKWVKGSEQSFIYINKVIYINKIDVTKCYGISVLLGSQKWTIYFEDEGYIEEFKETNDVYSKKLLTLIFSKVIQYDNILNKLVIYL